MGNTKRRLFLVFILTFTGIHPVSSQEPLRKLSLKKALNKAVKANKKLLELESRYKALKKHSIDLGTLPDPIASTTYFQKSTETRVGPQRYAVSLTQKFPWFGTLSLKEKKAYLEAKAAYYLYLSEKNKTAAETISNYLELAYLNKAISVIKAEKKLLKSWEKIVLNRYSTNEASQAPLLRIQVELTVLHDLIKTFQDKKRAVRAALSSLLHLPFNSAFQITDTEALTLPLPIKGGLIPKRKKLFNELNSSPFLKMAKIKLLAKEVGVKLAKRSLYPNFSLSLKYIGVGKRDAAGVESGKDAAAATLSLTIPVFYLKGKKAKIASAVEDKKAALNSYQWAKDDLTHQVEELLYQLNDSKRKAVLYGDSLLPKAQEALDTYYASFQTGKASFLDLLDSERTLLRLKLQYWNSLKKEKVSYANLLALLGKLAENKGENL